MPFGNRARFPIRSDLMDNPSPHFASTHEECVASTNFFDLPNLCKANLTQGGYTQFI